VEKILVLLKFCHKLKKLVFFHNKYYTNIVLSFYTKKCCENLLLFALFHENGKAHFSFIPSSTILTAVILDCQTSGQSTPGLKNANSAELILA
jgi:hypothetical protein